MADWRVRKAYLEIFVGEFQSDVYIDDKDGPLSGELVADFLLVQQRRNPQFRGSLVERQQRFSYPCIPRRTQPEKKWIPLLFLFEGL